MKILMTLLFIFSICGNVFPQIENIDSIKISKINAPDSVEIERIMKIHKKKFDKIWTKSNKLLGKDSIKIILSNLDVFYVLLYKIETEPNGKIVLNPSENPISDIIYVYGGYNIGGFEQSVSTYKNLYSISETRKPSSKSYQNYQQFDMTKMTEFFKSSPPIFAIKKYQEGYKNEGCFWFSYDTTGKLIKYEKITAMLTLSKL